MTFFHRGTLIRRMMVVLAGILVLVLSGASIASAQGLVQPDGRINQVHHFGGDALYCVDSNGSVTQGFADMLDDGGFRLLDNKGQEQWFVPADDIQAAIDQSIANQAAVLVAQGMGTYGPVRLYTYFDGVAQHFVFSGYDEHGKPNTLDFVSCTPVGPVPQPPAADEELCTLIQELRPVEDNGGPGPLDKRAINDVKGTPQIREVQVPCDQCPTQPPMQIASYAKPYAPLAALALIWVDVECVEFPIRLVTPQ